MEKYAQNDYFSMLKSITAIKLLEKMIHAMFVIENNTFGMDITYQSYISIKYSWYLHCIYFKTFCVNIFCAFFHNIALIYTSNYHMVQWWIMKVKTIKYDANTRSGYHKGWILIPSTSKYFYTRENNENFLHVIQ